jgi:hypothetical protein
MLSGAELNQVLMPAKFGAVPCTAATANGAVWSRVTSPPMQGKAVLVRQVAMTEVAAASDRIVMGNSIVKQGVDYRPIWPFG